MAAHDRSGLWAYAGAELSPEQRAGLEVHLASCAECRAELDSVRAARAALHTASARAPSVDWTRVDAAISSRVRSRVGRVPLWERLRMPVLVGTLAAAALTLVVARPWTYRTSRVPATAEAEVEALARVERSSGAARLGTEDAAAGAEVREHSVLSTEGGEAVVALSEHSRVLVSEHSRVEVARLATGEVRLELGQGRITTQAAHRPERRFEVSAGQLTVRVVGTSFSVVRSADAIEVSVAEGRVRVSGPFGDRLLSGGEHARFASAVAPVDGLTVADTAAFHELGVDVPVPAPAPAPVPPTPQPAPNPIAPPAPQHHRREHPPAQPKSPPVVGPAKQSPAAPADAHGANQHPATLNNVAPADEYPAASLDDLRVVHHDGAGDGSESAEEIFVRRAEESLHTGSCKKSIDGLHEVAEHAESSALRQKARILRARCFDDALQPDLARAEYQRYLREFPRGTYAREAKDAIDE